MARITGNILGNYDQSAGNLTFAKWKGIQVMKSKAEKVANPQTAKQMTQRNRLTAMTYYNAWYRAMWLAGFAKLAVGKSEYNVFTQRNLMNVTQADAIQVLSIDIAQLQLASGNTGNPVTYAVSTVGTQIKFEWDTNAVFPTDLPTDLLYMSITMNIAYAPLTREDLVGDIVVYPASAERSAGQLTVDLPPDAVAGAQLAIHFFFFNPTTKEASNSIAVLHTF